MVCPKQQLTRNLRYFDKAILTNGVVKTFESIHSEFGNSCTAEVLETISETLQRNLEVANSTKFIDRNPVTRCIKGVETLRKNLAKMEVTISDMPNEPLLPHQVQAVKRLERI